MRANAFAAILAASMLAVMSVPPVAADNDPIPDPVEATVCGFPAVANTINGLPPVILDYSQSESTSSSTSNKPEIEESDNQGVSGIGPIALLMAICLGAVLRRRQDRK